MPIEIQFGRKEAADRVRGDHAEHLSDADDKRLKKVRFEDDTPDDTLESIRLKADDSKGGSGEAAGQVELTDREKNQIDFAEAPVMRARSHKAIFLDEGVTDWLSFWSEDLTTNGEAREAAQRAKQDTSDVRLDDEPDVEERAAEAAQVVQSEECDHARGHCENGDMAACEFLRDECDYNSDEIDAVMSAAGDLEVDDAGTEQTEQTDLVTVGEDTADEMEVRPAVAGALRDSWAGYKAAVSRLSEDVGDIRKATVNARQASRAINAIRDDHGQEPLHFDRLHELLEVLEQMPGSIPETRTLEHFGGDGLEDTDPDPTPESDAGQEQADADGPTWEGQQLPDLPGAELTATNPPTYEFENGATVGIGVDADVTDDDPGRYFHKIVFADGREEYPHERLTPAEAVDHLHRHADEALGFDPDADPDDPDDTPEVDVDQRIGARPISEQAAGRRQSDPPDAVDVPTVPDMHDAISLIQQARKEGDEIQRGPEVASIFTDAVGDDFPMAAEIVDLEPSRFVMSKPSRVRSSLEGAVRSEQGEMGLRVFRRRVVDRAPEIAAILRGDDDDTPEVDVDQRIGARPISEQAAGEQRADAEVELGAVQESVKRGLVDAYERGNPGLAVSEVENARNTLTNDEIRDAVAVANWIFGRGNRWNAEGLLAEAGAGTGDTDTDVDVEDVVDMDEQRDMSGNRVDPQATFTTGEAGPDDGDVETPDDTNPGGLMADERDMSESVTERDPLGSDSTQGGLETFETGGRRDPEQGGLGSFSGSDGDSIETFQDAIDAIDAEIETYGQRIPFDADMLEYLDSQGLDQTVWTEGLSQDIARYGIDAPDVERRLREALEEHEQRGLLDGPADVDLYRQAITDYARSEL